VSGERSGAWFLSLVFQLSLRLRPLSAGEDENTMGLGRLQRQNGGRQRRRGFLFASTNLTGITDESGSNDGESDLAEARREIRRRGYATGPDVGPVDDQNEFGRSRMPSWISGRCIVQSDL